MSTTSLVACRATAKQRRGVGVDVEQLAVGVGSHGRDDRNPSGFNEVRNGLRVDLDDVTDEADVDRFAVDDRRGHLGAG